MKWSVVSPLRIALLDDHALIREALKVRLSMESDFKVVGVYASSEELIGALYEEQVDLLLLDYQLSDGELDGLRLIQMLRSHYPQMLILIFSSRERPAMVNMAIRGGANGFFGKSQPTDELMRAIRIVALGRLYLLPTLATKLERVPAAQKVQSGENILMGRGEELVSYPTLSPKEREVLRCLFEGLSVAEIAIKFSRSRKTISGQKQAALKKLSVRSNGELFKLQVHLESL
ncbi:response regulator transcription factor [Pseudomonas sp. TH03]|uniref:response regulator transcription factor n=1 Tax=Pseudomonas sp. TH03 TaxID=2796369 RepID=UPI00191267C6|nr:response regulator transcription factor [Pseudomonas sp. TH03]MBK5550154.1 response regulator transcription factor [Pseudomonas sp. TH03]